jgi:hypothetical protein
VPGSCSRLASASRPKASPKWARQSARDMGKALTGYSVPPASRTRSYTARLAATMRRAWTASSVGGNRSRLNVKHTGPGGSRSNGVLTDSRRTGETTTWPTGPRSAGVSLASSPATTGSTTGSPTKVVSHGCGNAQRPSDRSSRSKGASRSR